jgi:hypothetical protein
MSSVVAHFLHLIASASAHMRARAPPRALQARAAAPRACEQARRASEAARQGQG